MVTDNPITIELKQWGKAEYSLRGVVTITWRSCDTSRVDSKMLREKYPEIYAECLKTSSSRRFNVKEN